MGKEISPIIRVRDKKQETMVREISRKITVITKKREIQLGNIKPRNLARQFLFKEKYEDFFVPKEDYYIFPTVRLELWLLEKEYKSESS